MQGAVNGLADIADLELDFMLMISLYLNEALLKTRFQDASIKYQPLFVNKEVLTRTFINIKSHSDYSYYL